MVGPSVCDCALRGIPPPKTQCMRVGLSESWRMTNGPSDAPPIGEIEAEARVILFLLNQGRSSG